MAYHMEHDNRSGRDATPLHSPHIDPYRRIDHESMSTAELLVVCERLWHIARHPMGDPVYGTLRPKLLAALAELESEPHGVVRDFWISEIHRYLPKAYREGET